MLGRLSVCFVCDLCVACSLLFNWNTIQELTALELDAPVCRGCQSLGKRSSSLQTF